MVIYTKVTDITEYYGLWENINSVENDTMQMRVGVARNELLSCVSSL